MTPVQKAGLVAMLLVVAGCESDKAELERLKLAEASAYAKVVEWQNEVTGPLALRKNIVGAKDSLEAALLRHQLAERELYQLLRSKKGADHRPELP